MGSFIGLFDEENFEVKKGTKDFLLENNSYKVVLDGRIYNEKELKKDLEYVNEEMRTKTQEEILLKTFLNFGTNSFAKLNGAFSFVIMDTKQKQIHIVRDQFGIKPMYYTKVKNKIIFGTNLNEIMQLQEVKAVLDKNGIQEMFGIGPTHTQGTTLFKNIFEVKPANFLIYNKNGIYIEEYWKLKNEQHKESLEQTSEHIRFLIEDSIKRQLNSENSIGTMLSGGIDSSIVTAISAKECKDLKSFSVDYLDNDKNFVKSEFQPNSDNYYIDLMLRKYDISNKKILIDTPELIDKIEEAMWLRGAPGMADVDSSLLLFCNEIKSDVNIALSGECADEIFAGYPWFFREDALKSNTFPWSIAIKEREELLNPEISKNVDLREYINYRYKESLKNVDTFNLDSKQTAEKKKISYLTMNWFMQTLLDRADKMAAYSGLEIRVPFCDYRIVQYLWNIPWEMKALNSREKGLLRHCVKDLLPEEIIERKKSPYPKTHNPTYTKVVKEKLQKIIENKKSPINEFINKECVLKIIETDGKHFSRPWFGQLMTGPQLMAYLIQINMWLEHYQPQIDI